MDNCNKLKAFTAAEILAFVQLGLTAGDFLIHRGELCRVAMTKEFRLEWYNDQHPSDQKLWLNELNIKL